MNYKKLAKKYICVQKLSRRIIPRPSFISQHGKTFLSQLIGYSSMLLNKLATIFEIFNQQVTVRFLLMRNYLQKMTADVCYRLINRLFREQVPTQTVRAIQMQPNWCVLQFKVTSENLVFSFKYHSNEYFMTNNKYILLEFSQMD